MAGWEEKGAEQAQAQGAERGFLFYRELAVGWVGINGKALAYFRFEGLFTGGGKHVLPDGLITVSDEVGGHDKMRVETVIAVGVGKGFLTVDEDVVGGVVEFGGVEVVVLPPAVAGAHQK